MNVITIRLKPSETYRNCLSRRERCCLDVFIVVSPWQGMSGTEVRFPWHVQDALFKFFRVLKFNILFASEIFAKNIDKIL